MSSPTSCRTDVSRQQDCHRDNPEWPTTKAEMVQLLIEHGADVTAKDKALSTPLHLASSQGSVKSVQLLIEHGADVAAQDESHKTPLHLASSLVSSATESLLIQQQLDINHSVMATSGQPMR